MNAGLLSLTQRRKDAKSLPFLEGGFFGRASRLRAFAPSRENNKGASKTRGEELNRAAAANVSPGTQPRSVPWSHEKNTLYRTFHARWQWAALVFLREGAKARRREGRDIRLILSLLVPKLYLGTHLLPQLHCGVYHSGNRVAETLAFPNGVWAREPLIPFSL